MQNQENKLIKTLLLIKLINDVLTNPNSNEEKSVNPNDLLSTLFNLSPITEGEVGYDAKRNQIRFTGNKLNLLLEMVGYGQYKACLPESSYDIIDNGYGPFDFAVSLDELTGVPIGKVIITIEDKGITYIQLVKYGLKILTTSQFDNEDLSEEAKALINELVSLKSQFKSEGDSCGCGPNCKRCEEDASDYDEELYEALNGMDDDADEEPEDDEEPEPEESHEVPDSEESLFGRDRHVSWFDEAYRKIVDGFTRNPPATRPGIKREFIAPTDHEAKMYGKLRELFDLESKVKKKYRRQYFNTLIELGTLIEKNRK